MSDSVLVGNARLEGLTADLHITGNQYLFTLTIYFIGYVSPRMDAIIVLELTSKGSFRDSMQYYSQKMDAKSMAAHSHASMGNCRNAFGSLYQFRRLHCRPILSRCN